MTVQETHQCLLVHKYFAHKPRVKIVIHEATPVWYFALFDPFRTKRQGRSKVQRHTSTSCAASSRAIRATCMGESARRIVMIAGTGNFRRQQ